MEHGRWFSDLGSLAESLNEWEVTLESKRTHSPCRRHVPIKFRVWFVGLMLVLASVACAGPKGTGLDETLSLGEKKKVLEELKQNWQDYHVYCDGAASSPGALIFDPKNDDRNLIGYRYNKLSKEGSVRSAIIQIEFRLDFVPKLYRIFDENKNFYGYVLLAKDLPVPKRVDEKTLELPSYVSTYHVP